MELSKINKLTIGNENYNFSQEAQVGNMSGLGGIDVTKDVIYSTIDSQTNISISGECEVGKKITVICESSVNTSIKIDDSKVSTSTEGNNILVTSPGDVFTLEIYCTEVNKYFLIKKGINELPFSGEVGDVVLYNSNSDSFMSVTPGDLSKFSYSNYTPIGIVAIPSSSGRYGEGISGIISLEDLESGAEVYWGEEKLTGITKDLDGSDNTKQCLLFRGKKDYSSWYPDYTNGSDYPAASLCNRYTVFGKSVSSNRLLANTELSEGYGSAESGNWYLPVISELSKIDINTINTSINTVSEVFTSINTSNIIGNYWTSTESSIEDAYCYSTAFGKTNSNKLEKRKVRAFIKINSNGEIVPMEIDYDSPIEFSIHIDRSESNPSKMVTVEGSNPELLLSRFRRCVAKSSGGKARICFLDDKDTTKFEDGTVVNLEGLDGDVMVYFPEFWYLGEEIGSKHVWNISSAEKPGYYHSPASLVGVYKGVIDNNGLVRSISGTNPSVNSTNTPLPIGYDHINYHQHCVIAWMFLARYGTTDSQSKCGVGVNPWGTDVITTGSTNSMGIRDTSSSSQGSVNFLGIEDVWGSLGEIVSSINVSSLDTFAIIRNNGEEESVEEVVSNLGRRGDGTIKDIVSGNYMDIIPYVTTTTSSTSYYTDLAIVDSNSITSLMTRSSLVVEEKNNDINSNGIFTTNIVDRKDVVTDSSKYKIGCRLGFEGEIEVIKYSSEYRNPVQVPVEFTIHINRSESDPSKMVTLTGGDPELLLRRFRRCIVNKGSSESSAKVIYLNDIDSNYYSDLTPANLDGTDGDVMVYFPEFWYLGETTSSEHTWNISSTEKPGYYHSPASLVGAYKGYVKGSILKSVSGVTPLDNASYGSFRTYARNAGDGFHIINYHQHCVIAWMFLARYGTTDSQSKCGTCKDSSGGFLRTGSTNYLGMMDTNASISKIDSDVLVNFLGIEGCWGHVGEWIDDVYYNTEGSVVVNDKHISTVRDLTISEIGTANTISDVYGGSYMDVFPTSTTTDSKKYYTDITKLTKGVSGRNTYSRRSEHTTSGDSNSEGVFYLVTNLESSQSEATLGSRLAYDGDITVSSGSLVKATVTFKSTPSNAKIQYKVDNEPWTSISSGQSIEVVLGSTVYYKASLTGYYDFTEESRVISTTANTISITLRQVTDYQFELYPAFDDQTYEVQYSINNKDYNNYATGGLITSLKRNDTVYYRAFGKGYTCEYGSYTATINSDDNMSTTTSHEQSRVVFTTDESKFSDYIEDDPSILVYNSGDSTSDYAEYSLSLGGSNTVNDADYGWFYSWVNYRFSTPVVVTKYRWTKTQAGYGYSTKYYYTGTTPSIKSGRTNTSEGIRSIDLTKYNSSEVRYMGGMFSGCNMIASLDLSTFVFRRTKSMADMFKDCTSLTYLDISNYTQSDFNSNSIGSNGENASGMFTGCNNLSHIKCRQWFKDWCIRNQDTIGLPSALRNGSGNWEIYS